MSAIPKQAPIAPRPIMMPMAIAVKPWMFERNYCMMTPEVKRGKLKMKS
jgi:hypothetical protein